MRKVRIFLINLLLYLAMGILAFAFAGCELFPSNEEETPVLTVTDVEIVGNEEVFIGEFDWESYKVREKYGKDQSKDVPFTEDMLSEEDRAKLTTVGTHTITITYKEFTVTFTITVKLHEFSEVKFDDVVATYDGMEKTIAVTGAPDGAEIVYDVENTYTNAGVYVVKATVTKENYVPLELTATLTINKAIYDMEDVVFENDSVTYDGQSHSLEAVSLPQGISVSSYDNNGQINAGSYTVTAHFEGANENYVIEDMTAVLTIEKRELEIFFSGETTLKYNGNAQRTISAEATNLVGNDRVEISIGYNGDMIEAGMYTATATIAETNYKLTKNNTVTVTITREEHTVTFRQQGFVDVTRTVLDLAGLTDIPIPRTENGYAVEWERTEFTCVTEDILVQAKKTLIDYQVEYVLYGGVNAEGNPNDYNITEEYTLLAPERKGYAFDGWYTDDAFKNGITEIELGSYGKLVLYAKWNANENTLKFNANGATSGVMADLTVCTDERITLPQNVFRKAQYHFIGWAKEPNGAAVYVDGGYYAMGADSEYVLYAVWEYGTSGLKYFLYDDYCVVDGYEGEETEVIVPSTYRGLAVTSIRRQAFKSCTEVTSIVISEGVTGIGYSAFAYCENLTNITLPDSLQSIEYEVFYDCTKLTDVTLPDGLTELGRSAFLNCSKLKNINIPNGVTILGEYTFLGCVSLENVVMGEGIKTIGAKAFYGCALLKGVSFYGELTEIGEYAFYDCDAITALEIPDNVTTIGEYAFYDCDGLESLVISNGLNNLDITVFYSCDKLIEVSSPAFAIAYIPQGNLQSLTITSGETIETGALSSCVSLKSLTLAESLRSIGDSAFYGCTGLKEIKIPDGVTSIGNSAFGKCTGLTSVNIPNGLTSLSEHLFVGCTNLASIIIPDNVKSFGNGVFYGCTSLNNVQIPSHITAISNNMFTSCTSLKTLEIPDKVTSIGSSAFWNCTNLESIEIPVGVTEIGIYAFCDCSSLQKIVIPDGVTEIGELVFARCTSLESLTIPDSVTTISSSAFNSTENLTSLTLPAFALSYIKKSNVQKVVVTSGDCIPARAFYNITSLTDIAIADTVTSIGDYAFYNCTGLMNIQSLASCKTIGAYAFYNCDKLEQITLSKATFIGSLAFQGCSNLVTVMLSAYLTSIEGGAFYDCVSLTSIHIPDNVNTIGNRAFYNCVSLASITVGENNKNYKSIDNNLYTKDGTCLIQYAVGQSKNEFVIPNHVTSIGQEAFYGCESLIYIEIPDGVLSIGSQAFVACLNLEYNIKDGLKYLGNENNPYLYLKGVESASITIANIDSNCRFIADGVFNNCYSLTSVTIPSGVVGSLGFSTFAHCSSLTSIIIPDGIVELGSYVFDHCRALTTLILPDGIVSIGAAAFDNCSSLTEIVISNKVISIGNWAFNGCTSLTNVYYKGTEEDWEKIVIGNNNDCLNIATIYYYVENEVDVPTDGGNYWHYDTDGKTILLWE